MAVALPGEERARPEDFAGSSGFAHTRVGGSRGRRLRTALFAPVQIQERHVMARIGVARDRAAASVFGVSRMAAGDDHFEFPLSVNLAWNGGGNESYSTSHELPAGD